MKLIPRTLRGLVLFVLAVAFAPALHPQAATPAATTYPPIFNYIDHGWDVLTRSMSDCGTITDPKVTTTSILYVPKDFPITDQLHALEQKCAVEVRPLPIVIHKLGEIDTDHFNPHGLLYLPNRYVVPGGRFNEMYGWDSYFIAIGLLQDHRVDLARSMVENFFFEIDHYGSILNDDRTWLQRAYDYISRDHAMWISPQMLAGNTGLSRYYDFGNGPAPESLKDETDHHRKVVEYFLNHPEPGVDRFDERLPGENNELGPGTVYSLRLCAVPGGMERPHCGPLRELTLNRDFYKGDRAMRESGFDISFRFGPFGADTHHYAPVCLNSLLFKTEMDLAEISQILGHNSDAAIWKQKAELRRAAIDKYLWNESKGEFFDYDFTKNKQSTYEYITTYYPLWAGLATPQQAKAVLANLKTFEQLGGAVMSPYNTGAQWDFPYAWAPTQMILVEGLRRYGFTEDAGRIAYKFAGTIAENYAKEGYIVEKYNGVTRSTDSAVTSGYNINVIGFGWTNAAYLEFLHQLPESQRTELTHSK